MRKAHTLLSLAITATAFVSSASAQSLEVADEATGNHCPAVTTTGTDVDGGCLTHLTSQNKIELRKHVFGIESHITSCDNEFAGRVAENATGRIFEQVLSGTGCVRQACAVDNAEGEKTSWTASASENALQGTVEGPEYLTITFCVEPREGGTDETCEIDIPLQSYEMQHRQEYGHNTEFPGHSTGGFRCELVGHWNSETGGTHD